MSIRRLVFMGLVALLGWLVALVGAPVAAMVDNPSWGEEEPTGADYRRLARALANDPVQIAADSDLSRQQRASIREDATEGKVSTYVVALPGESWSVTADEVAGELLRRLGQETVDARPVVLVYLGERAVPAFGLRALVQGDDAAAALAGVNDSALTNPASRFELLVELVSHQRGGAYLSQQVAERVGDLPEQRPDDEPGIIRWVVLGLVGAVVGVFLLLRGRAVAGWWRRRRRGARFEEYADGARASRDRATADRRLLALGEALDAHEMEPDHVTQHWQQALDYYALAGRVSDLRRNAADDVGVMVLCDWGERHFSAARGGDFDQSPHCYLDPLHAQGTRSDTVDGVSVALCERCFAQRPQNRRPFRVGGQPWYRSQSAPWVGNGYGTLADLQVTVTKWLAKRDT